MATAFTVSAAFDLCALLVVLLAIRMKRPAAATADAAAPAQDPAAERGLLAEAEVETELDLAEGPG